MVFEKASARMLPLANRTADVAAISPACCNACRTCVTTNVVGLAFAGAAGVAAGVLRFATRLGRTS
jgi:hypothetical protein